MEECTVHAQARRAQGVAFAAALSRELVISEYARENQAINNWNGFSVKGQVAAMVQRILKIADEDMPKHLDVLMDLPQHFAIIFSLVRRQRRAGCGRR